VIVTIIAGIAVGLARPSIALAQATCSSTASIACGEVKAGNISAVGQTDCFTFTAEAGEVVNLLSKAVGSSIQACSQLRDPSGNIVGTDACGQPSTITLPATGTYTIRLFDRSNDETGAYNVQLQVLSATTSSCPVATVPCGATPGGILGSIVQSNTYRFVATEADEVVSITAADVKDPPFEACWQLYAADGSPLGTLECAEATRTLPAAGAYHSGLRRRQRRHRDVLPRRHRALGDGSGLPRRETRMRRDPRGQHQRARGQRRLLDHDDVPERGRRHHDRHDLRNDKGVLASLQCRRHLDGRRDRLRSQSQGARDHHAGTYVLRVFDQTYGGRRDLRRLRDDRPGVPCDPDTDSTPTHPPPRVRRARRQRAPRPGTARTRLHRSQRVARRQPRWHPPHPAASHVGGTPNGAGTETPGGAGTGTPGTGIPTSTIGPPRDADAPQHSSIQNLEAALDDFLCYATKLTRGGPRFTPALAVRLNDTLGSTRFNVRKPTRLCAPADKDGNGIVDPIANLERYVAADAWHSALRPQRGGSSPRSARSLDTIRPDQLLVPTAESAVAQPTALDAASHHVDTTNATRYA
jgi:hypothetical protein